MVANSYQSTRNALLIAEIVALIIENVDTASDLLACARVNSMWMIPALKKLYRGSLSDMQFRTPGIALLNSLFVASRQRFVRNMSFVKHLLVAPEQPAYTNCGGSCGRPRCFEKPRLMRYRHRWELFLRAQPRGPTSIMIPFELVGHHLEYISDYLGQESVEFLAINNHDCTHIVCYPKVGRPDEQFPNLKALTVYVSEEDPAIGGLCRLLMIRDLEFVHVEEWDGRERNDIAREIMPHLEKQKNLKALALNTNGSDSPPVGEEGESLWPKLKSLYIRRVNEDWFVQLPKFKELELLMLLPHYNISIFSSSILAEAVAKCKNLRSIYIPTLRLGSVNDVDQNIHLLLDVARGCPLLQKLYVADFGNMEVREPFLLDLVKALPRLEFLKLGLVSRVYGTELQDIARHCPRLTFLELVGAKLYISLTQMTRTLPLHHLEIMCFEKIFFKRPLHIGRGAKFQTLVTEWSRIFPKLQMKPCVNEWEIAPVMMERLDGGGTIWESSEEEPLFPDTDDEEADYEWRWVNSKLWEALKYGEYNEYTVKKRQYLWDINLQIETIGWPMIPSAAFIDPNLYST